jgi:hypothetical protein
MSEQKQPAAVVEIRPAEANYEPSYSLGEELRVDSQRRSALAALAPGASGTFVDNGTDRWHFLVVSGTPGILTVQLQVSDEVIWWKHIEIYANFFGSWFNIRTLGTHDDQRTATTDLSPADAQSGTLKLDFWRAGFLNFGAFVTSQVLDVTSNLGNKVIYLCDRPKDRG